jgi:predicted O-methyltransferase YrrM
MISSYNNKINFGDIISSITFLKNPKKIVECGILEGYSLDKFILNSDTDTQIDAYDIFDKFHGNHAIKDKIIKQFSPHKNVNIEYGDFYNVFKLHENKSIDILHIDIANNGDVYEFMFQNYVDKLKDDGIILMEGGSEERDNIEWMIKYNKSKIKPVLKKYSENYDIKIIGKIPSITIIKKK